MSGAGLVQPGDVAITEVSLANSSGNTISVQGQLIGFSIYESVMSPVVTAELILYDPIDQLSSLPIVGEETCRIKFKTGGFKTDASYDLVTTSLEHQTIMPHSRGKYYVVRLASTEVLKNLSTLVNKKYMDDASSVVSSILSEKLSSQKKVTTDKTKGIQELTIGRTRPFQAIDMVRRRAVSAQYQSASYAFFETQDGFTFATMEYLADIGKGKIGDKVFVFDSATNVDFTAPVFRNVLGFRNTSMFHNARKIGLGGLKNLVRKFDLLTGEVSDVTYDDQADGSQFKFASSSSSSLNSQQFAGKYGTDTSVNLLVPKYSALTENYAADYAGKRQAFVTRMGQNTYQAHFWGDSTLKAGDVITMKIPTAHGTTDAQAEAELVSGNFLVTKLRHIVTGSVSTERRRYTCAVELVKGFYEGKGLG